MCVVAAGLRFKLWHDVLEGVVCELDNSPEVQRVVAEKLAAMPGQGQQAYSATAFMKVGWAGCTLSRACADPGYVVPDQLCLELCPYDGPASPRHSGPGPDTVGRRMHSPYTHA